MVTLFLTPLSQQLNAGHGSARWRLDFVVVELLSQPWEWMGAT